MKNVGFNNITSFEVSYTVDGGDPVIYQVSGINVGMGENYGFTHDTPIVLNDPGNHQIVVSIPTVNGGPDDNPANNSITTYVAVVPYLLPKKVFAEEATGTWCGWCVRGICFMDYMAETYPDTWLGVAVHNGDPMVNTAWDAAIPNIIPGFIGYPQATIDRVASWDPSELEQGYLERIEAISPASVNIVNFSWEPSTRVVTFDIQSEFIVDVNHELRFAAVFSEDSVWGRGAGWAQANNYSGGEQGPMCGFEDLPGSIPDVDMHYDHVGRAILDDPYGTPGSLPTNIISGNTYSYTYTYTLPDAWVFEKMHFIGLLIDMSTGEVLNCNEYDPTIGIKENGADLDVNIYPNPFRNSTNMVFTLDHAEHVGVKIINLVGSTIYSQNVKYYPAGENRIQIDGENFRNGLYFIELTIGNQKYTQKVSVIK